MFGEFNRQSGDAPREANWEGWTPPWMGREGEGPRGWQGHRGPFGHRHGFGGPGRGWGGHRGWQGHRGPFGPGRGWGIPDEILALRTEAAEVARLFAIASRGAFENKERVTQLRAFLDRSRKELSDMIYSSAQPSSEGESASGPTDVGQA